MADPFRKKSSGAGGGREVGANNGGGGTAGGAADGGGGPAGAAGSGGGLGPVRALRIMKELQRVETEQPGEPAFTAELVDDSLFEWHVRLHRVDPDSDLAQDMKDMGVPYILLHIVFPDNYPYDPPFMRVVSPRIEKGFVMQGGAICMELLTPDGWKASYTVEGIVMQFAATVVKGKGRIAKEHKGSKDYNIHSAQESFRHLLKIHKKSGWSTPPLADG